jgi:hypothetical protein
MEKYRIKQVLLDDYTYAYYPQIKNSWLGWKNIYSETFDPNKYTTNIEDVKKTSVTYSYKNISYSTELAAKIIIKYHHLKLELENKLKENHKNDKKTIIINVDPNEE